MCLSGPPMDSSMHVHDTAIARNAMILVLSIASCVYLATSCGSYGFGDAVRFGGQISTVSTTGEVINAKNLITKLGGAFLKWTWQCF